MNILSNTTLSDRCILKKVKEKSQTPDWINEILQHNFPYIQRKNLRIVYDGNGYNIVVKPSQVGLLSRIEIK